MKGDYSRTTFDPRKHFSGVRMQQGRVQVDADSNEQGDITNHRVEIEADDVIGLCGAPLHYPAFHIVGDFNDLSLEEQGLIENALPKTGFKVPFKVPDFLISAGRYYVDGLLCENEQITSYLNQPDLPHLANPALPPVISAQGWYLVYVDVWRRLLTALDDPSMREIALGGPDTAAREKTVWQIKFWSAGANPVNCGTKFSDFEKLIAPSDGKLSARSKPPAPGSNPCIIPPEAGYTGLENQFYRIEIHDTGDALDVTSGGAGTTATMVPGKSNQISVAGSWPVGQAIEVYSKADADKLNGTLGYITAVNGVKRTLDIDVSKIPSDSLLVRKVKATFKWSRDNGVVVTSIQNISGKDVTVHDLGRDDVLGFKEGQWVEISDDAIELNGLPGQLAQITGIDPAINQITIDAAPSLTFDSKLNPKLRRWDGIGAVKYHPKNTEDHFLDLENGVQMRFFPPDLKTAKDDFRTGDYWTVPARTATAEKQSGNVEWPRELNTPVAQLPFGIRHHYCRLAILHWDGNAFNVHEDCRKLFPPLTELTSFFYVSGENQEVMPDLTLPALPVTLLQLTKPLIVGVANGTAPVKDAEVRFHVITGSGQLVPIGAAGTFNQVNPTTIDVLTDKDGLASCTWKVDSTTQTQQLKATLQRVTDLPDTTDDPIHLPVIFTANLSVASQVAYNPGTCKPFAQDKTVQRAIDRLSDLASLYEFSGNDQEIIPGQPLKPLMVLAANRCGTIPDKQVSFTVISGGGTVTPVGSGKTDGNGQASCVWTPGPTAVYQEAEARLAPDPLHPDAAPNIVRFTCTRVIAANVVYDPKNCAGLSADHVTNVQDAIDHLCQVHQGGGCCDVTVGKGGEFERLDQAIKKLLEEKRIDICICLLPGDHELPQGLIISDPNDKNPVTHVKITGCGLATRLRVGSSQSQNQSFLRIGPLASFTLRDLAAETRTNTQLIHCNGCAEVIIENCHLYAHTGELLGPPTVLIVEQAKFISVTGNYLSSLFEIQPAFDAGKFERAVPFSTKTITSLATDIAAKLAAVAPAGRQQFLKPYQDFLKASPNISPTQRTTMEGSINILVATKQRSNAAATITESVATREIVFGTTLSLLDSNADTLLENNRFMGRITLYGNNEWFIDAEWKEFLRLLQRGTFKLTSPAAALQIRSNLLTGIRVDKKIQEQVTGEQLRGLFGRILVTDNWCYSEIYQLLASQLNISSNQFNYDESENFEAGAVGARAVVIVGNSALAPASRLFYAIPPPGSTGTINAAQLAANFLDVRPL